MFNSVSFLLFVPDKPFCQINLGFVYLWETDEASAKCGGVSDNTCMAQTAFPWRILSVWITAEQFNSLKSDQWPFQRRWCQFQLEVNHDIWYVVLQKEKRTMWTGQQRVHFPVNAWTKSIHWLQCNLLWIIVTATCMWYSRKKIYLFNMFNRVWTESPEKNFLVISHVPVLTKTFQNKPEIKFKY